MKSESSNTFANGLVMDLNPLTTPNNVITDCINGTFLTFNGDELVLQSDMGNGVIKNENGVEVTLSDGFKPLGVKEYGGVLYIVSGKDNEFVNYTSIQNNTSFNKYLHWYYFNTPNYECYLIKSNLTGNKTLQQLKDASILLGKTTDISKISSFAKSEIEFGSYPSIVPAEGIDKSKTSSPLLYKKIPMTELSVQSGSTIKFDCSDNNLDNFSYYDSNSNLIRKIYDIKLYHKLESGLYDLTPWIGKHPSNLNNRWFNSEQSIKYNGKYKGTLSSYLIIEPIDLFELTEINQTYNGGYKIDFTLNWSSDCSIKVKGVQIDYTIGTNSFVYASETDFVEGENTVTIKIPTEINNEIVRGKTVNYTITPIFTLEDSYPQLVSYIKTSGFEINDYIYVSKYAISETEEGKTPIQFKIVATPTQTLEVQKGTTDADTLNNLVAKINSLKETYPQLNDRTYSYYNTEPYLNSIKVSGGNINVSPNTILTKYKEELTLPTEYKEPFIITGSSILSATGDDFNLVLHETINTCMISPDKYRKYYIAVLKDLNGDLITNDFSTVDGNNWYGFVENDYWSLSSNQAALIASGFNNLGTFVINETVGDNLGLPSSVTYSTDPNLSVSDAVKTELLKTRFILYDETCDSTKTDLILFPIIPEIYLKNAANEIINPFITKIGGNLNTTYTKRTFYYWPAADGDDIIIGGFPKYQDAKSIKVRKSFSLSDIPTGNNILNSGTLVIGKTYRIAATQTNYFGTGLEVNDDFIATQELILSDNNSVIELIYYQGCAFVYRVTDNQVVEVDGYIKGFTRTYDNYTVDVKDVDNDLQNDQIWRSQIFVADITKTADRYIWDSEVKYSKLFPENSLSTLRYNAGARINNDNGTNLDFDLDGSSLEYDSNESKWIFTYPDDYNAIRISRIYSLLGVDGDITDWKIYSIYASGTNYPIDEIDFNWNKSTRKIKFSTTASLPTTPTSSGLYFRCKINRFTFDDDFNYSWTPNDILKWIYETDTQPTETPEEQESNLHLNANTGNYVFSTNDFVYVEGVKFKAYY